MCLRHLVHTGFCLLHDDEYPLAAQVNVAAALCFWVPTDWLNRRESKGRPVIVPAALNMVVDHGTAEAFDLTGSSRR